MTEKRIRKLRYLLQASRYRLINMHGDLAMPLREKFFVATKNVRRISTSGEYIYFDPDWLQKLGENEMDFMLIHQIMHIELGHINRPMYYKGDKFHLACDIVANSVLSQLGWYYESLPGIGKIYTETFFPIKEGAELTPQEAMKYIPFDPAAIKKTKRKYVIDSEEYWDNKRGLGASDVIVLKPGDEDPFDDYSIDIKTVKYSYKYSGKYKQEELFGIEVHSDEKKSEKAQSDRQWKYSLENKIESIKKNTNKTELADVSGEFEDRFWELSKQKRLDWKRILNIFVQTEICDYSFTPPDRRLQDSSFFLPDFNVLESKPQEVLFLVDTSGSITTETLSIVYAELCSVLEQYNGKITGILGFFDTRVYRPTMFFDVEDLQKIKPIGGGGTDFYCIFNYVSDNMANSPPASIVIFTDGESEFPPEFLANNIPVLWLFSKENVRAPWGKSAYIKIE